MNDLAKYFQASEYVEDIAKRPPDDKKLGGFDFLLLAYAGLYIYWRVKNA